MRTKQVNLYKKWGFTASLMDISELCQRMGTVESRGVLTGYFVGDVSEIKKGELEIKGYPGTYENYRSMAREILSPRNLRYRSDAFHIAITTLLRRNNISKKQLTHECLGSDLIISLQRATGIEGLSHYRDLRKEKFSQLFGGERDLNGETFSFIRFSKSEEGLGILNFLTFDGAFRIRSGQERLREFQTSNLLSAYGQTLQLGK